MTSPTESTLVIVPTYNERGNLEALVDRLRELKLPGLQLLFVDDNSPDGTGQLADRLHERFPDFVHVIHRPGKLGMGTAYIDGFRWALEHEAGLILTMDADFSHPPDKLPEMVQQSRQYDVVIGSRFAPGGSLDERWGWTRRLLSGLGNNYARLLTGLPLHDLTGGFRCYRREVLEAIDLGSVRSAGFVFHLEVTYACYRKGFQITEIPIYFAERSYGNSKMSLPIIWEAFWRVLELRARY